MISQSAYIGISTQAYGLQHSGLTFSRGLPHQINQILFKQVTDNSSKVRKTNTIAITETYHSFSKLFRQILVLFWYGYAVIIPPFVLVVIGHGVGYCVCSIHCGNGTAIIIIHFLWSNILAVLTSCGCFLLDRRQRIYLRLQGCGQCSDFRFLDITTHRLNFY